MTNTNRYDEGLAIRRAVLGTEYVNNAVAQASKYGQPLQDLVTEYCWGAVWSRPGLDRRERSLVNIGMLTALNRPEELKLHIRGAVNNGCSAEDVFEVLLQTAVYCGIPAAVDAFRLAETVLREAERGDSDGKKEEKATSDEGGE